MSNLPYQKKLADYHGNHKLLYVDIVARQILDEYGLHKWKINFSKRKTDFGRCWYSTKTIDLSIYLVNHNSIDIIHDILLHEIAHALVKAGHGHGPKWRALAEKLGVRSIPHCNFAIGCKHSYIAECEKCDIEYYRYRQVKQGSRKYCTKCGGGLRFKKVC